MTLGILGIFTARVLVAIIALLLDWRFADPVRLCRVPHPVILIGRLIARTEAILRPASTSRSVVYLWGAGVLAVLSVLLISLALSHVFLAVGSWLGMMIVNGLTRWFPIIQDWSIALIVPGLLCELLLVFWLLAAKGLHDHVLWVAQAKDIASARTGLRALAGRDAQKLDHAGVLRTAGESLAENYSDAVVAPLFWYLVLGLGGIVAYKAINSMDSMWGYRDHNYRQFGWAAARLDDVVNMVPARLSALLLFFAALASPQACASAGWRCMWRDASRHPSPNAGYPEAMMAGALGLRFGGPRHYTGGITETLWLGSGRQDWCSSDVYRCLHLYRWSVVLLGACMLDVVIIGHVLQGWLG